MKETISLKANQPKNAVKSPNVAKMVMKEPEKSLGINKTSCPQPDIGLIVVLAEKANNKKDKTRSIIMIFFGGLTACVTCAGAQGRRSRPTRKRLRRRKLIGMCAESPASGACFVGRHAWKLPTLPTLFNDEPLTYLIVKAFQTSFNRLPIDGFIL